MNAHEIQQLIDTNGPKLAELLNTTIDKVYPKILWYVRISGVIGIIQDAIWLVIIVVVVFISGKKLHAYNTNNYADNIDTVGHWGMWLFLMIGIGMILGFAICTFTQNTIKIISPEYWLLHQAIRGFTYKLY